MITDIPASINIIIVQSNAMHIDNETVVSD